LRQYPFNKKLHSQTEIRGNPCKIILHKKLLKNAGDIDIWGQFCKHVQLLCMQIPKAQKYTHDLHFLDL